MKKRPAIMTVATNVRNVLEEFYDDFTLECKCAIASTMLCFALEKHGYKPVLYWGDYYDEMGYCCGDHCWVSCGGKIYDLTATQFEDLETNILVCELQGSLAKQKYRDVQRLDYHDYRKTFWKWGEQKPLKKHIKMAVDAELDIDIKAALCEKK